MSKSHLSILLKHLHINAKDLAQGIHVDPSLVSRWQTGDRILKKNSEHLNRIVQYILEYDKNTAYRNIETFYEYYYPNCQIFDRTNMFDSLKNWIVGQETGPQNVYLEKPKNLIQAGLLKGDRQKKKALLDFLDLAINCKERKNVYIMIGMDTFSLLENGNFYREWITKLYDILSCGHSIYFIYNHTFASFANDLQGFFSLCSSDSFYAYYLPRRGLITNPFNLLIVEDIIAMTDFATTEELQDTTLFSFAEKNIIKQLTIEYNNYLQSCQLLNDNMSIGHNQLYTYLEDRISEQQNVYIYDETLYFLPLPTEKIKEILTHNNFSVKETEDIIKKYETLFINRSPENVQGQIPHYILINIDEVINHLYNNFESLSSRFPWILLSPEEIFIPKETHIEYIKYLIQYISDPQAHKHLKIKFVNNAYMSGNTKIAFIAKDYLFALALPYKTEFRKPVLFTNPTVISDASNYLEEYWTNVPQELNDLSIIKSQLEKALKDLENLL